jgi:MoaA/NifB/PqqE/SkfB family radical SAM enzyme
MNDAYSAPVEMAQHELFGRMENARAMFDVSFELTARCNLNCHHCYINLPTGDRTARAAEITVDEIDRWTDEALKLGTLWCLLTGGEPLLRPDFSEIYMKLKKKGLLVTVFTNAVLIDEEHVALFRQYPPREIEVSVYGVTPETYGRLTRKLDTFDAFIRGVELLEASGVRVSYKSVAMRANYDEMAAIADFCREHSSEPFRFDPFLHLRYDRDPVRNSEIWAERLNAAEIVALEESNPARLKSVEQECEHGPEVDHHTTHDSLFHCGIGKAAGGTITYDGKFLPCGELRHPDCAYDLRRGTLKEAWRVFTPGVMSMKTGNAEYHEHSQNEGHVNLCMSCPAHNFLETGELDNPVDYFCEVAHARERVVERNLRHKIALMTVAAG